MLAQLFHAFFPNIFLVKKSENLKIKTGLEITRVATYLSKYNKGMVRLVFSFYSSFPIPDGIMSECVRKMALKRNTFSFFKDFIYLPETEREKARAGGREGKREREADCSREPDPG